MQAVIALCHFCENHGPRVVMTCQPMRNSEDKDAPCSPSTSFEPSTSDSPPGFVVPIIKLEGDFDAFKRNQTPSEDGTLYPHYGNCTKFTIDTEDRCSACTSFRNGPCLLSNDHQTKTSYISSEIALQERVYERVKSACLRSLSCERSTVHTSKKKSVPTPPPPLPVDSESKKSEVINEVPLNGTRNPTMPTLLHESNGDSSAATPVGEEADGCVVFGDMESGYCFAFIFRLADAKARGYHRLFSLIVVSNDLTFLTNNFEYFKTTLGGIKTDLQKLAQNVFLEEIEAAEKITERDIHKPEYHNIVGKPAANWFRRKVVIDTDRNLTVVTATEEIWIRLHRFMMWTLRSPTLVCRDQVMEGKPTQDMMVLMELEESKIVELELHHPNQHSVSMSQLANLKIIANQLYACSEPGDLDLLIHHIVTGGQVAVESNEKEYCRQFLLAISNLLPIGCIKLATYKEQYLPEYSTRFNLIGGPHNMDIPLEVSDVIVIRVSPRDPTVYDSEKVSLENCVFEVRRRPEEYGSIGLLPQIVKRYHTLLLDTVVKDRILDAALRSVREMWMHKAKICFQLQNTIPAADIFSFITGVQNEDHQVVMYWTAGLSDAYKQHVITTIESTLNGTCTSATGPRI